MSANVKAMIDACCDGRGLNTVRLRRLFTVLAQDLFSDPEQLDEYREELACLKYDVENPKASQLHIGPSFVARGKDVSNGIFISVQEMRLEKVGMGDRMSVSQDGATVTYVKKAKANIRLRIRHTDIDVALMMGESMVVYFEALEPLLKHVPGLLEYDVVYMGEAGEDKPEPEARYRVDLHLRVVYQLLIEVTQESHKLKKFGIAVTAS